MLYSVIVCVLISALLLKPEAVKFTVKTRGIWNLTILFQRWLRRVRWISLYLTYIHHLKKPGRLKGFQVMLEKMTLRMFLWGFQHAYCICGGFSVKVDSEVAVIRVWTSRLAPRRCESYLASKNVLLSFLLVMGLCWRPAKWPSEHVVTYVNFYDLHDNTYDNNRFLFPFLPDFGKFTIMPLIRNYSELL